MAGQTTTLKIPYPTGTDRVADGDNAMQSLAERVEARMPWGWVAYVEKVTAQGSITTAVDIAGLTVTVTHVAGRKVRISGYTGCYSTAANGSFLFSLVDSLGNGLQMADATLPSVAGNATYAHLSVVLAPAAGARTYKMVGQCIGGTGTQHATAIRPAYLLVEDLGPAVLT